MKVQLNSGITGDLPIDKPTERRALCIRYAIDTQARRDLHDFTAAEVEADVLVTAAAFERYIRTGETA